MIGKTYLKSVAITQALNNQKVTNEVCNWDEVALGSSLTETLPYPRFIPNRQARRIDE